MKYLILALLLTGCVTPSKWKPMDHQETMMVCRSMSGDEKVKKYDPFTGQCSCEVSYESHK